MDRFAGWEVKKLRGLEVKRCIILKYTPEC